MSEHTHLTQQNQQTQAGLDPTVDRYLSLKEQQKKLEKQARQIEKDAKTLERALSDAVEANGGMLETQKHLLAFKEVPGRPSYKSICEKHIAPAVLSEEVKNTPPRRKLDIV